MRSWSISTLFAVVASGSLASSAPLAWSGWVADGTSAPPSETPWPRSLMTWSSVALQRPLLIGCGWPISHLSPDHAELPLPGSHSRRLEPPGRGLGYGRSSPHRAGRGRARHGGAAPPTNRWAHPPLRPRLPVHQSRLQPPLPRGGYRAVHGLRGGLFRQRHGGELQCHVGVRADRPNSPLADACRGASSSVRLRRRVLQPAPSSLCARPPQPSRVRKEVRSDRRCLRLTCPRRWGNSTLPSVRYSPVSWKPCAQAAQDAPVNEIE